MNSTPLAISKKRELASPDDPSELKKNRFVTDSVNTSHSDIDTTMDEQLALPVYSDEHGLNTTAKDSASNENLSITLGNSDMEAIASVLKESFKLDLKESIREQLPLMVNDIISGVVSGLNAKVSALEHESKKLAAENTELKVRMNKLELAIDNAEQYSRRNSLRMSGVPETATENTDTLVLDAARAINSDIDLCDIDRSHRVGRPRAGKPCDIIVKFATYRSRQKLYKNRVQLKDKGYRGVFLNEDLTKFRLDLLYKARGLVRSARIKGAWTSDGTVLVKDGSDVVHRIISGADLARFEDQRGVRD